MNKYNFDRTGFEVSRGGRASHSHCGCDSHSHRHDEIKGSYGETLNRSGGRVKLSGENSCGCGCGTGINSRYGLTDRPVGSVYAPLHDFDGLYDPEKALKRGTLFSSLDLPLEVASGGGKCRG